jgi:DNA-binding NarL/FixJ family response regulator
VIEVLLVDDEQLIRTGLAMIMTAEPDLTVVGQAGNGAEALAAMARLDPDVVVMDVRMPVLDGIETTRQIVAAANVRTAVLMLTTYRADEQVRAALRAGASGYVLKDAAPDELVSAVRAVAAGEAWLDPAVARSLLNDFAREPVADEPPDRTTAPELTVREREVLRLMAHGMTNAEISRFFTIAETTTKTHVGRILIKLGLHDRSQAVAYAYRRHLLDADDPLPPRP